MNTQLTRLFRNILYSSMPRWLYTLSFPYLQVACTNWKRVMFVLKQGEPYQDPSPISRYVVHAPGKFPLLNSFPRIEIKVSPYSDLRSVLKLKNQKFVSL